MSKRFWIVTIVIIVAVLLIGQAVVYYANPYHASIEVKKVTDEIAEYDFSTNYSLNCNIISISETNDVSSYYAYYDTCYPNGPNIDRDNMKYYLDWMKTQMSRDSLTLNFVNASEVKDLMTSNEKSAIIFASGSLPSTIYSGNSHDLIFKWLENGGLMYWLNGKIGHYYSELNANDATPVVDSDVLFFNEKDVVRSDTSTLSSRDFEKKGVADLLGVYYSECTNGVRVSGLHTKYLAMDNNAEGYYSVSLIKYYGGTGCICVFGGCLDYDMLVPVLQIIESKISYNSEIIDYAIVSGSSTGTLNIRLGGSIFSYIGEMESVWRHNCDV